jgi:hypothetical protein
LEVDALRYRALKVAPAEKPIPTLSISAYIKSFAWLSSLIVACNDPTLDEFDESKEDISRLLLSARHAHSLWYSHLLLSKVPEYARRPRILY